MDETGRSFHIYVDETSKNAKYFGIGAIFCRRDAAEQIASYLSDAVVRHEQRPEKELHWTELKGHLLPLYSDVGTTLVTYAQRPKPKMRYRALMVESQHIDRSLDERRTVRTSSPNSSSRSSMALPPTSAPTSTTMSSSTRRMAKRGQA